MSVGGECCVMVTTLLFKTSMTGTRSRVGLSLRGAVRLTGSDSLRTFHARGVCLSNC